MKPNTKKYLSALFLIAIWGVFASGVIVMASSAKADVESTPVIIEQEPELPLVIGLISEGREMKVTAFSSVECHTKWCHANPERVGHQVALNAKYGKASSVFIKELNQTYEVIGTTNEKTDLDIYFGTDGDGAKQFGVHYYHIEIL